MSLPRAGARAWCGVAIVLLAAALPAVAIPGTLRAGHYTIYYNAFTGSDLPLASTRAYALRHAPDQGVVNITVTAGPADTSPNVAATVTGRATTLLGAPVHMTVRYVHDPAGNESALLTFTLSPPQTIRFTLDVTPRGGPTTRLVFVHSYAP